MINHLYTNGCSWTAGNGIEFDPILSHIPWSEKYNYLNKLNWPSKLASHLNITFTNEGMGAGSNKRIVRTTCNFLRNYPKKEYKNLLVVLGWTSVDRSEMYFKENEILKSWCMFNASQTASSHGLLFRPDFSPNFLSNIDEWQKQYITDFYDEYPNYLYYFQEMYLMSNLLENLGIKYVFFSSLPWKNSTSIKIILESFEEEIRELKKPNILQTRECDDSLNVMSTFCLKNNLPMAADNHTMIEGHDKWAIHLFNEIKGIYPNI
jgi:hypothetical protein